MSANIFEYNEDVFLETCSAYEGTINSLNEIKNMIGDNLKPLREGWKTEAGAAFLDQYTNQWEPILDRYIGLLEYLKECLEAGITLYGPVLSSAREIIYKEN